jgi:hypothetical protein
LCQQKVRTKLGASSRLSTLTLLSSFLLPHSTYTAPGGHQVAAVTSKITRKYQNTNTMVGEKREASGSEEPTNAEGDHIKRRKRIDVDASLIISDGRSKRRKTPTPQPEEEVKVKKEDDPLDPKDAERATKLGKELYDKLNAVKDKE